MFDGLDELEVISFGKYKGKSVREILDTDPKYILWLDSTVPTITISNEMVLEAEASIEYDDENLQEMHFEDSIDWYK